MRSKNQEVDPLFAQFITKDFLIQRIFRVLRNSLFRTNDLYSKKCLFTRIYGDNMLILSVIFLTVKIK